jgi:hypothetical protein
LARTPPTGRVCDEIQSRLRCGTNVKKKTKSKTATELSRSKREREENSIKNRTATGQGSEIYRVHKPERKEVEIRSEFIKFPMLQKSKAKKKLREVKKKIG